MERQKILEYTAQLLVAAAVELAERRRPLLAQQINLSRADHSRQVAERVLRLAELQTSSGRHDHARSERILECYRELRLRLSSTTQTSQKQNFARALHDTAQTRALDWAVGFYLAALMTLTSLQVSGESKYAGDWNLLLLTLQTDLHDLASMASGAQPPDADSCDPPLPVFFSDIPAEPQARQILDLEADTEVHVLPPDPQSGVRFALGQLALIIIWPDGRRRDIDLAGLVDEEQHLPSLEHSPKIVGADPEPSVLYVDRRGIEHFIAYNRSAMQYRHRSALPAA